MVVFLVAFTCISSLFTGSGSTPFHLYPEYVKAALMISFFVTLCGVIDMGVHFIRSFLDFICSLPVPILGGYFFVLSLVDLDRIKYSNIDFYFETHRKFDLMEVFVCCIYQRKTLQNVLNIWYFLDCETKFMIYFKLFVLCLSNLFPIFSYFGPCGVTQT
jgi:hypothetical protein